MKNQLIAPILVLMSIGGNDSSMLARAQNKSNTINIDLGKAFGDAKNWFESDEVQDAIEKVEDEIERMEPEIEKWLDENWNDQWREDSGDRWDSVNKDLGWDLDQVQEEFDDFFSKNDASPIVFDGSAPNEKFDLEVKNTMSLYDMGIKSGKVTDEEHHNNDSARFQKLYDLALQSGKNSLATQDIEFEDVAKSFTPKA